MSESNLIPTIRSYTHSSANGVHRRSRKACDRCRLKKGKCNGLFPCSRCKADNLVCCFSGETRSPKRNYPKGYTELLERQQNQLVSGLQEMYYRLRNASIWEDEPLDDSGGHPLSHDILAALGVVEPKGDGSGKLEAFRDVYESPRSHLGRRMPRSDRQLDALSGHMPELTPSWPSGSLARITPLLTHSPTQSAISKASSAPLSPSNNSSILSPERPQRLQQRLQNRPLHLSLAESLPIKTSQSQLLPASIPLPFDDPEISSLESAHVPLNKDTYEQTVWNEHGAALQAPIFDRSVNLFEGCSPAEQRSAPNVQLSLSRDRLYNGIGFDSTDFISDFSNLWSIDTNGVNIGNPMGTQAPSY